jgi:hypothetical protein
MRSKWTFSSWKQRGLLLTWYFRSWYGMKIDPSQWKSSGATISQLPIHRQLSPRKNQTRQSWLNSESEWERHHMGEPRKIYQKLFPYECQVRFIRADENVIKVMQPYLLAWLISGQGDSDSWTAWPESRRMWLSDHMHQIWIHLSKRMSRSEVLVTWELFFQTKNQRVWHHLSKNKNSYSYLVNLSFRYQSRLVLIFLIKNFPRSGWTILNLHVRSRPLCLQLVCFPNRRMPGSERLRLRLCRRLLTSQIDPHFSNAAQKIVSRLPLLLPSVLNNVVSKRAHVHLLWLFLWERHRFCSSFDSRIRTRACQLQMNGMILPAKLLNRINLLLTDDVAEWAETNPDATGRGRAFWRIIEYL